MVNLFWIILGIQLFTGELHTPILWVHYVNMVLKVACSFITIKNSFFLNFLSNVNFCNMRPQVKTTIGGIITIRTSFVFYSLMYLFYMAAQCLLKSKYSITLVAWPFLCLNFTTASISLKMFCQLLKYISTILTDLFGFISVPFPAMASWNGFSYLLAYGS